MGSRIKTAVACGLAVLTLCGASEGEKPRELVIIYTGDSGAEVESCGCNLLAYGGLARRATLVNILREAYPDAVFVDTGDFFSPNVGEQDRLKDRITAAAYGSFGYDAVNLGEDDFNFGADFLAELAGEYNIPLISVNVVGSDDEPLVPSYKIVKRGGLRVGVVGFLDADVAATRDLGGAAVTPHKKPLRRAVEDLSSQVDVIICLAHVGNADRARAFTGRCPKDIAVVIGGHRGGRTPEAEEIKGRWMVYTRSRNRYVGMLKLTLDEKNRVTAAENEVIPVTKETALDERTQVFVNEYYAALRELVKEKKLLKPPEDVPSGGFIYVGSSRCEECHAAQADQWKSTGHASAYESLADAGRETDPECVSCHVTGYGFRGGFLWTTDPPTSADVGCEDCHGPGEGHAQSPALKTATITEETCTPCHDAERSPSFDYESYLSRVEH
jgi:2',3'-cyclic-nucleotide 2'-phosphodiesterase (5'-nucleotidase family)